MDLSFAALGWLHRSAQAVGSDRFPETAHRSRFYLEKAAGHAQTPAEAAVVGALAAGLDAVVAADAEARTLLEASVAGITDACSDEIDQLLDGAEEAA